MQWLWTSKTISVGSSFHWKRLLWNLGLAVVHWNDSTFFPGLHFFTLAKGWCQNKRCAPFGLVQGLGRDIFWPPSPFNLTTSLQGCNRTWGAMPRNRGIPLSQCTLKYARIQSAIAFFGRQVYGQWNNGAVPYVRRTLKRLRTSSFRMAISTPGAQVRVTGLVEL